mgnify:CR=1 FL=1
MFIKGFAKNCYVTTCAKKLYFNLTAKFLGIFNN